MAKKVKQLSEIKLKTLKIPGAYADGDGLYFQVTKTGSRSWFYRYQHQGKQRKQGLGSYPTVTLAMARDKTLACRQLLVSGVDPIQDRRQKKLDAELKANRQKTFRYCAEQYIDSKKGEWSNAKHVYQWTQSLDHYAYPIIGDTPVQEIGIVQILDVLQPIWNTKTETATRVRQRIEAILDWAKVRQFRAGENPALWRGTLDKLLPKPSKIRIVRHQPAMPYDLLPEYFAGLQEQNSVAALALQFIILTATRSGEARMATWDEIVGDTWIIPAERMKSRRAFRIPLLPAARDVLAKVEEKAGKGTHVFPGREIGISDTSVRNVLHDMYPEYTVHGFRSTFRDWCAEKTNFPRELAESALGHVLQDKTEAAYQRGDLFEKRRELMGAWATYCLSNQQKGKIVPLSQAS